MDRKLQSKMQNVFKKAAAHVPPPDKHVNASAKGIRLHVAAHGRPETISVLTGTAGVDPETVEESFSMMLSSDGGKMSSFVPYLRCGYRKERGNKLFAQGKYSEAIDMYLSGMRAILGEGFELPTKEYLNDTYTTVLAGANRFKDVIDLAACATNIAQCYIKMDKVVEALDWIEEVDIIYIVYKHVQRPADPSWLDLNLALMEYITLRIKTYQRGMALFRQLDNTASAVSTASRGYTLANQFSEAENGDAIKAMMEQIPLFQLTSRRHPDPPIVYKQEVKIPELQIRGIWKKIPLAKGAKPRPRQCFASWVWGGKLYITGGYNELIEYSDTWCLDLTSFQWLQLDDLPKDVAAKRRNEWQMKVWNDTAFLFTGSPDSIWTYNLVNGKWQKKKTTFKSRGGQKWPYNANLVHQYNALVLEDKLYIFGGDDNNVCLGTNILTALDLQSLTWEHISGTSDNVPKTFEPNLRRQALMWADPEHRRFYLMFGNAGRMNALLNHKKWGFENDYTYDDFWSFDIVERKWHRERMRGNFPSPRTETSAIYHPTLKRAIVYGGYNSSSSTSVSTTVLYNYSYFGDTFLFDPKTKIWKHVLTRGFPAYRATAEFAIDSQTGKTYLYGGYTNSEYVPSKSSGAARMFGDIWQLKLDMEGGDISDEDLRRDNQAESMGPFKRCFGCGSFGKSWMKCGGSCGGQYFFCSTDCQKDSWKEHRDTHGCGKR